MSPRKRKFYRPPPRRRPDRNQEDHAQRGLDAAARALVAQHTSAELRSMAREWQEALDWADQQAQQNPSPEALHRYRDARRTLAEVERALSLAQD